MSMRAAGEIAICLDAGPRVGMGHLTRCAAVARALLARGARVRLIARCSQGASLRHAAGVGARLQLLPAQAPLSAFARALEVDRGADSVLLDLAHNDTPGFRPAVAALARRLQASTSNLALFDTFGDSALRELIIWRASDLLIAPYVGETPRGAARHRRLLGTRYFVLGPAFIGRKRRIRAHASRVLVTCGGADPTRMTLLVLRALDRLERPLRVQVTIGPFFSAGLRRETEAAARHSRHRIDLLQSPSDLAPHMRWCDIAVGASGLTKYEFAATGTPSILLSIDHVHARVNSQFARAGTSIDLGVASRVSEKALGAAVERLLADPVRRRRLARRGQALVDGDGARRVAAQVLRARSKEVRA
ncbi:MAG: hypothetical protein AB1452_18125 [Pseudomonadota bacterium]